MLVDRCSQRFQTSKRLIDRSVGLGNLCRYAPGDPDSQLRRSYCFSFRCNSSETEQGDDSLKYLPKTATSPVLSTHSSMFSAVCPAAEKITIGDSFEGSAVVGLVFEYSEGDEKEEVSTPRMIARN